MGNDYISFLHSLISGGIAGISVDIVLFPIDTIKTRLQSPQGLWKSGGFRGIYKGLSAAAIGSAPGAALFFCTYDTINKSLDKNYNINKQIQQMISASFGEIIACLVRVPTENIKQKMQVGRFKTIKEVISHVIKVDGLKGFYTGYNITVMREIPFAFIQFPIYEYIKSLIESNRKNKTKSYEAAFAGSISGGIAAAITTPLDVLKTRLMLQCDVHGVKYNGLIDTFKRIIKEEGSKTLLSGIGPRVMWISIGGFVFFGAYEQTKKLLNR